MNKRNSTPVVSVLLATHNGATYLPQALDSMAAQTFSDWEWILVDDGSTDNTPALLADYRRSLGDRVRIIHNENNIGLTASLNRGLAEARGEFVARMDDDDIAHRERLERQIKVMRRDPKLLLLGTAGYRLDESTNTVLPYLSDYDSLRLRINLCWFNPFMHASVMFRSKLPDGSAVRYDEAYETAQDYALWAMLSLAGRVSILAEKLMTNRVRQGSITGKRRVLQVESARRIGYWYTKKLFANSSIEGCSPEEVQDWIDDRTFPDKHRIAKVKHLFAAAVLRPANITNYERQKSFMNWAETFLDQQSWTEIVSPERNILLRACGGSATTYLLRRLARRLKKWRINT